MISLTCGIKKIKQRNACQENRNRLIDIESKLVVTRGKRDMKARWRYGIKRYKLLCMK